MSEVKLDEALQAKNITPNEVNRSVLRVFLTACKASEVAQALNCKLVYACLADLHRYLSLMEEHLAVSSSFDENVL